MTSVRAPSEVLWSIEDLAYHQVRVLLLVSAVSARQEHARKLDGLTKLAKLDFLVRYPGLIDRVLPNVDPADARLHLTENERSEPTEVDDPMMRYKYGPWDDKYYPVIGALVARGLTRYVRGRRGSVALAPTASGRSLADELGTSELWRQMADRCSAVAEFSGGLTGNALKDRIYETLPELMNRPHREVIS